MSRCRGMRRFARTGGFRKRGEFNLRDLGERFREVGDFPREGHPQDRLLGSMAAFGENGARESREPDSHEENLSDSPAMTPPTKP